MFRRVCAARRLRGFAGWAGLFAIVAAGRVRGDLIIPEVAQSVVVDFSSFAGDGLSPFPSPGQLDSATWRVGGFTDGTLDYGGTGVTGDFARGKSSGGVTSGGLYAFQVASGDSALGVQATGTDFNPGFFELRIRNMTGSAIADWNIGFDMYCRNDQGRSTAWDLSYSTDGQTFADLPSVAFRSPTTADSTVFERTAFSTVVPVNVADDDRFYLRWTSADFGGSGSRDEFALDNVSITATATPEPGTLVLTGLATVGLVAHRWRRRRRTAQGPGPQSSTPQPNP
jgi:hypothetical protein